MITPSKARGAPHYSFPILSVSELLVCLAELQIPFTEEQLKKPTAENIRRVFEHLLEFLMSVSHEELSQPIFSAMQQLQYPELHEESVSLIAFHRAMQKLMSASGIHDFSMRDYLHPEFQRLRRILSGVVNFAKFREERLVRFQQLTDQSEHLLQSRSKLENENLKLRAELDKLKAAREKELPEIQAAETQIDAYAEEMSNLNQQQSTLQNELRELKTANTEISDKLAEEKFAVLNETQEICRLQSQVVRSPERVKKEIEEMQETLDTEKENLKSMRNHSRQLSQRADGIEKCELELQRLLKLMADCETEMQQAKAIKEAIIDHNAQISEKQGELQKLAQAHTHCVRQAKSVEDRLLRVKKQASDRRAESQAAQEEMQAELQMVEQEREAVNKRVLSNEEMEAHTKRKIEEMTAAHNQELDELRAKYSALEKSVVEYHRQLFQVMQEVRVLESCQ